MAYDDDDKLRPTFSIPGPGGSMGKCALCGDTFLKEILLGETVAMLSCSWFPGQRLPMHQKCADIIENCHLATELPEGPLKTAWRNSDAKNEQERDCTPIVESHTEGKP